MQTKKRTVYVNMTDSFMSGWGQAPGSSYYCVKCPDRQTADAIERAALDRDEMKRIALSDNPRRPRSSADHLKIVEPSDLGGPWLDYFPKVQCSHPGCHTYLPDRSFGEETGLTCYAHTQEPTA